MLLVSIIPSKAPLSEQYNRSVIRVTAGAAAPSHAPATCFFMFQKYVCVLPGCCSDVVRTLLNWSKCFFWLLKIWPYQLLGKDTVHTGLGMNLKCNVSFQLERGRFNSAFTKCHYAAKRGGEQSRVVSSNGCAHASFLGKQSVMRAEQLSLCLLTTINLYWGVASIKKGFIHRDTDMFAEKARPTLIAAMDHSSEDPPPRSFGWCRVCVTMSHAEVWNQCSKWHYNTLCVIEWWGKDRE